MTLNCFFFSQFFVSSGQKGDSSRKPKGILTNHGSLIKNGNLNILPFGNSTDKHQVLDILKKESKKIRSCQTSIEFLMRYMDTFSAAYIQLDVLAIYHIDSEIKLEKFIEYEKKLLKLQTHGFFNDLHLFHVNDIVPPYIHSQILCSVKLLHLANSTHKVLDVSEMVNVEHLYIDKLEQIYEYKATIMGLKKLHNLNIKSKVSMKNLSPFIQKLTNLRKIKINSIVDDSTFFRINILNMKALNEEREKCEGEKKLTFYLEDDIFEATKRIYPKKKIGLIEIMKHSSYKEEREVNCK